MASSSWRSRKLMASWVKATEECSVVNVCVERHSSQERQLSPPLLLCPQLALPMKPDIILYACVRGYLDFFRLTKEATFTLLLPHPRDLCGLQPCSVGRGGISIMLTWTHWCLSERHIVFIQYHTMGVAGLAGPKFMQHCMSAYLITYSAARNVPNHDEGIQGVPSPSEGPATAAADSPPRSDKRGFDLWPGTKQHNVQSKRPYKFHIDTVVIFTHSAHVAWVAIIPICAPMGMSVSQCGVIRYMVGPFLYWGLRNWLIMPLTNKYLVLGWWSSDFYSDSKT